MSNIDWKNLGLKEFVAIISKILLEHNVDIVLTGGACVSIYSKNVYQTKDIDFVTSKSLKEIEKVLKKYNFKKEGTHFYHDECKWYVEFLPFPVAIGSDYNVNNFNEMNEKLGKIILLTPTDSVRDRLAAYYHWNDPQSLEQAILIALNNKIDFKIIKNWSEKENHLEKYKIFIEKLKKRKL